LSTGFIARAFPTGFRTTTPVGEVAHRLAAVAVAMDHVANERKRMISGQMRTARPVRFERDRAVMLDDCRIDVRIDEGDLGLLVRFEASGAARLCVSDWGPGQALWRGTIDGEDICVQVRPIRDGYVLTHRGSCAEARVYTRREAALAALMPRKARPSGARRLLCPMPGVVRGLHVVIGQAVKAGEPLCTVEAMKMENVLQATEDGIVKAIHVTVGETLGVDAVIMQFT
jgi:propionyl-CoA carboxylase alpha chain